MKLSGKGLGFNQRLTATSFIHAQHEHLDQNPQKHPEIGKEPGRLPLVLRSSAQRNLAPTTPLPYSCYFADFTSCHYPFTHSILATPAPVSLRGPGTLPGSHPWAIPLASPGVECSSPDRCMTEVCCLASVCFFGLPQ